MNGYCSINGLSGYANNQPPYALWFVAATMKDGVASGSVQCNANGQMFTGTVTDMKMVDNGTSTITAEGDLDGEAALATITLIEGTGDKSKLSIFSDTIDPKLGIQISDGQQRGPVVDIAPAPMSDLYPAYVSSSDKISGPGDLKFDAGTGIPVAGSAL